MNLIRECTSVKALTSVGGNPTSPQPQEQQEHGRDVFAEQTGEQNIPDREVFSLTRILPSREKKMEIGFFSACRTKIYHGQQKKEQEGQLLQPWIMSRLLSLVINTSHGFRILLTFS